MRNVPALRLVKHFHDHPGYIAALAQSVRDYWTANGRPDRLVMSFHGVPRFTLERGDPYHCECQKTGRLLAEALRCSPSSTWSPSSRASAAPNGSSPTPMDTVEALGRKKTAPRRRGLSRVRLRLPGDPGGDRDREQGRVPERRRRRVPLHPLPERARRLDRGAGRHRAGAICRAGSSRLRTSRAPQRTRQRRASARSPWAQPAD